MIRDVHPGSGSWFFAHSGSRGQKGTGSRIRILNTESFDQDKNHCPVLINKSDFFHINIKEILKYVMWSGRGYLREGIEENSANKLQMFLPCHNKHYKIWKKFCVYWPASFSSLLVASFYNADRMNDMKFKRSWGERGDISSRLGVDQQNSVDASIILRIICHLKNKNKTIFTQSVNDIIYVR